MLVSRWKIMAGVLGVSVGGFAALGQGTKPVETTVGPPIVPLVAAESPKVIPPTPTPAPVVDAPKFGPPAPQVPDVPVLPALPDVNPTSSKPVPPKPEAVVPAAGSTLPALPKFEPPVVKPNPPAAPLPTPPSFEPPQRPSSAPQTLDPFVGKPAATPDLPSLPATAVTVPMTFESKPIATTVPVVAVPTKFRIVLRVGEGEPTFEVRHGDDLVMKVKCDKVDIKSPEKGQGLSEVTASGKVQFVGFGAEGTCDTLSFLAGTGEVAMTGKVNVKVRDKIGRVESELTTESLKYKLDNTALTGVLKP